MRISPYGSGLGFYQANRLSSASTANGNYKIVDYIAAKDPFNPRESVNYRTMVIGYEDRVSFKEAEELLWTIEDDIAPDTSVEAVGIHILDSDTRLRKGLATTLDLRNLSARIKANPHETIPAPVLDFNDPDQRDLIETVHKKFPNANIFIVDVDAKTSFKQTFIIPKFELNVADIEANDPLTLKKKTFKTLQFGSHEEFAEPNIRYIDGLGYLQDFLSKLYYMEPNEEVEALSFNGKDSSSLERDLGFYVVGANSLNPDTRSDNDGKTKRKLRAFVEGLNIKFPNARVLIVNAEKGSKDTHKMTLEIPKLI